MDERSARALLCSYLPVLREQAELGDWAELLDMHVAEVAQGAPALAACVEIGLVGGDHTVRGGPGQRLPGLEAVALRGDYGCPHLRCARQADRDEDARVPLCEISGDPMVFKARR